MKTQFIGFLLLLLAAASVSGQRAVQTTLPTDTIRAVFCDIDNHDYSSAMKKLESLPESDQRSPAVRKLLVAVQSRMIKEDDQTPENHALIRKAIKGYEGLLKELQLKTEEQKQIDSSLLHLYDQLGGEELNRS